MSWSWTKIGDCAELISGAAFKSNQFTVNSDDVPLVKGENVQQGFIDWGIAKRWPKPDMPSYERFLLAPNDIVVAMDRPWVPAGLKWAFIADSDPQALLVQRVARLRVASSTSAKFLKYVIASKAFCDYVRNIMGGTNVPHISGDQIRAFGFRRPSLPLQEKIGDRLSAYDDLIENNRRRIALLEQSARLLYREWFVHLRFPGHEHVNVVDGVPEGWVLCSAFDAMDVMSGGTPKTDVSDYWHGEIPFFTPKDAVDAPYVLDTEKHLTDRGLAACNSRLYPKDTIFITARGTVGNLNLAQAPMAMNQSCYALKGKDDLSQFFLFNALKEGVQQFKSRAGGAVFDAIVVNTFKLIPFLRPPQALVREYTELVDPMFCQIDRLLLQSAKLREARDLLLPRLMSGDLAV